MKRIVPVILACIFLLSLAACSPSSNVSAASSSAERYEYTVHVETWVNDEMLNEYAREGWRLVSTATHGTGSNERFYLFFERPVR